MITSVRLRNFKCFRQQLLEFSPLTLLSGLNGMGKSSVLQALLLLRQSFHQGTLPDTGVTLNGELLRLGTAQDVLYQDALEDELEIGVRWGPETEAAFVLGYDREADVLQMASKTVQGPVYNTSLFSDRFHYLQAERLGPRVASPVSDYMVRHRRQIGSAGEYAAHYLAVFGDDKIPIPELAHPQTESLLLRHQVEAWLGEISPGVRLNITPHPKMDSVNLEYSFVDGSVRTGAFRSTGVGFGITYTLPVVLAVLSANTGALVLLENPEAHLHPKGQAQIGRLLAKAAAAGVQVAAETHSDHVLNGIRVAVHEDLIPADKISIHFFTRSGDADGMCANIISPRMYPDGRIDKWPEGFFDEWDRSLEALLAPKEA
jgi:predicted ATPase